jgi:predicted deacylase
MIGAAVLCLAVARMQAEAQQKPDTAVVLPPVVSPAAASVPDSVASAPGEAPVPDRDVSAPGEASVPDGDPGPAGKPDRAEEDHEAAGTLTILGQRILRGTRVRLVWSSGTTFSGEPMSVPVVVIHGARPGRVLCLTGAIHGDELNGIEVIRRVLEAVDPADLAGTLIGVPIVNMAGYSRGSRYLPDRRDLNRFFPGNPNGSSASRIAYDFFHSVILYCEALVDFHTGSFDRANLPQVRGDLRLPEVVELTRGFGATAVLHAPGATGMLRRAATDRGIPAVTFELGAPLRLEPAEIEHGVKAIDTLLSYLGMNSRLRLWKEPQPIFYESRWVRATRAGMLFSDVRLGDRVRAGQRLGRVIDPLRDESVELVSPVRGRVLGMALNQVVLPGYAAYHIGEEASMAQVVRDARLTPDGPGDSEGMDAGATAEDEQEGSTEQVEDYSEDPEGRQR